MPQNSVISIVQTRDGYLCLGTLNGLARFDGRQFTVFDESNTPGLDSSKVIRVFQDSKGNLWLGTESGGVLLLEPDGKFRRLDLAPGVAGGRTTAIAEDVAGAVWLYTADGQLGRYRDGKMDVWNAQITARTAVRALASDTDGFVWVGTDTSLLGYGPMPVTGIDLPPAYGATLRKLDFLLASKGGGVWRFAEGEIRLYRGDRLIRSLGRYPWAEGLTVSAACEDSEGNLIVGTYGEPGDGVYWFRPNGTAEHIRGLSHQSILSLVVDHDGCLWIGTNGGGLNRVRRQLFDVLALTEGSTVQSVAPDRSGGLWIAYNGDRVDHWSTNGVRQYPLPGVLAIRSVLVDQAGTVWAGAFGSGLFYLRNDAFVSDKSFAAVGNPFISAMFEDRSGRLWVGTQGGLVYREGTNWRTFSTLNGLSANNVQAIAQDAAGTLWVGTEGGGLNRITGNTVTVFTKTNGLPGNNVSALLIDSVGVLWVGTSSGLAYIDSKHQRPAGERAQAVAAQGDEQGRAIPATAPALVEGLQGNSVRYLTEDEESSLWVGSNAGVMRILRSEVQSPPPESATGKPFALGKTGLIRTFGKPEGLPTRECTQGSQPAAARTADGKLWFPTIKGLASIDPKTITRNTNSPPVYLEQVFIDGVPQRTNSLVGMAPQTVTIPAPKETLDIHFVVLNLSAPERAIYRYHLENHETSWTEGGGNRGIAHYTKLPAGQYTFRVAAANEDYVWNSSGAMLSVTVLPPFWQTWWFLALTTFLMLGMIIGLVHFISTQKLQRQLAALRQQEALEKERARIARDLHDQLGANLTQVALLGELAEADKNLPREVESHARQISQTARETTRSLDEIVWTVNPANDTLDGLINYICKYAQEYLATAGLRYRIEVPPQLPALPISPELRHNVFLAVKEAVNNVVKHAHATSAWVRLDLQPDRFSLEIQDDGRGMKEADRNKGRNGLQNMRTRMSDVGGEFTVGPAAGGGTLVRLTAPLQAAPAKA